MIPAGRKLKIFRPSRLLYVLIATLILPGSIAHGQAPENDSRSRIEKRLEDRISENPDDGNAWRMLGRLKQKSGELKLAGQLLSEAARLAPENVAVHFDLATVLQALGHDEAADREFELVIALAPTSDYAQRAQQSLATQPPAEPAINRVTPAGFEITRFDNSDLAPTTEELEADPAQRWHIRLEAGALFNSNLALTPISRELFPGRRESAQAFIAPEFEYRVIDNESWSAGPIFRGHFTQNEGNFSNLHLQSYQPGLFVEKVFLAECAVIVPRLEYGFTHDEFNGKTFGNRHSLMASAAAVQDDGDLTFGYLSVNNTNFTRDGVTPSITSQDGWTYGLGASHSLAYDRRWLKSVRLGVDLQLADIQGSDYRYRGISLFTDAEIPLTETVSFHPEVSWGYRDYPDFSGAPSRNEHVWRGGARLVKQINEHWSINAVLNYDRFDSQNDMFSADRYTAGLTTIFEY